MEDARALKHTVPNSGSTQSVGSDFQEQMANESSNHLANLYSTNDQEIRDEAWLSTEFVYRVTWYAPRFEEEEEEKQALPT